MQLVAECGNIQGALGGEQRPVLDGVGRQLMDHQRNRGRCAFAHAHPRYGYPNAAGKCALIVIGREQHRQQVTEQRSAPLAPGKRTDEIMGPVKRGKPLD
ncbi:hypothetical protein LJR219_003694 [Phenylobacterium sp. LjRoot219]|uniref:hypothetical protein n=1 Tax=Phenylobacterium sp. LjRoot219 TaxID=3342283 RepID=UPI003ECFEB67